jgi:hypothetical protein
VEGKGGGKCPAVFLDDGAGETDDGRLTIDAAAVGGETRPRLAVSNQQADALQDLEGGVVDRLDLLRSKECALFHLMQSPFNGFWKSAPGSRIVIAPGLLIGKSPGCRRPGDYSPGGAGCQMKVDICSSARCCAQVSLAKKLPGSWDRGSP